MKKLITNYTFNPIAKTIVFTDYATIDLSQVLLITNTTDNIIIYNFACTGGTVSWNTLTLAYDTSAMDSGDSLQIYYDDAVADSYTETIKDLTVVLAQLNRNLTRPTWIEWTTGRMRAVVEASAAISIWSGTITNLTTLSGYTTTDQVWAINRVSFAQNVISNIP